ncbi:hypothetical protein AYI70_g9132 [Smittium culicis]|uniref:Uncharacterized protein n=1 Tax=Smittium culicis TaxID=133412 RepID=A0A1R1XCQ1_9FUNG|nr:hypothetical protein AYI70_g9132 [Smittium culicis]
MPIALKRKKKDNPYKGVNVGKIMQPGQLGRPVELKYKSDGDQVLSTRSLETCFAQSRLIGQLPVIMRHLYLHFSERTSSIIVIRCSHK